MSAVEASIHERVVELQRQIHSQPELGFDTFKTAEIAAEELRGAGLHVRTEVGRTGVVADLEVPGASRRIAFRADMDALPIDEVNDLPHRSLVPGVAHLCGHDAHTAMLIGAALALAPLRNSLTASVRFIFQPNEEMLPGGAPGMIEDGCLDGVDRIFGMHVWPLIDTGFIGIHEGPTMGRPDGLKIKVRGVGGHAAAPHVVRDPVVCASAIVTSLQQIVSRRVDPLASAVVSVTQFHAGSADNVIPEQVELSGTIRTFDDVVANEIGEAIETIATSVGRAHGMASVEVSITRGYPVVVNDSGACDEAERAIQRAVPTTREVEPILGGEDFAYYQQQVPGAFLFLGNRGAKPETHFFCHHPKFQVDDAALRLGTEAWVALATR